jgi:hypothetical protein
MTVTREIIRSSVLGREANDALARAKLITDVWNALAAASRIGWEPFVTFCAESSSGETGVVQLATIGGRGRKTFSNQIICNLPELDTVLYQRVNELLKNRVGPNDIVSKNTPSEELANGFVTFIVRRENLVELLESYFTQVLDMPHDFKLTITEVSE